MESSRNLHKFTVGTQGGQPVEQVRKGLHRLAEQMRALGLRSCDLLEMQWSVVQPARYYPRRREIDLAYREVFGGFRPPIALRESSSSLQIDATALAPLPSSDLPVWRGYSLRELEQQMSPRSGAVSMEAVFQDKRDRGDRFREGQASAAYDIPYGENRNEVFDLFYPEGDGPFSLWVFIHGGYWQASDKRDVHDLAQQMLKAGYAVAMQNYGLCPDYSLTHVVDQIRRSLIFMNEHSASLGVQSYLHIAGTSAGGHLAALMACDQKLDFIRSALIISGIHDVRPLGMLPIGRLLGIVNEEANVLSPALLRPPCDARIGVAFGECESPEFRRMSCDLAAAWNGVLLEVRGKAHFNVTDDLAVGGPLAELAQALANG